MSLELPTGHPCLNEKTNVYEALGWFLANFTILENTLKILLLHAIGADLQAGYFLVARLDARALVPKIRAALRQKYRVGDDFKDILIGINDITGVRNYLSHCAPEFDNHHSKIRCIEFGATLAGGKVPSRIYSTNHLKHLAFYAMAATGDVMYAIDCLTLGEKPAIAGLAKAVFPQKAPVEGQFDRGTPRTLAQTPVAEAQARIREKRRERKMRQSRPAGSE